MFQRSAILRRALASSSQRQRRAVQVAALRGLSSSAAESSSPLSETEQWRREGIVDERGLVNFDTLHNMQVRSCRVFAEKRLFATYSEESQQFEWMTFRECKSPARYSGALFS